MSDTAYVASLPKCDFCTALAKFDFKTWMGPWANGCTKHYQEYRANVNLGTGLGQRLVVGEKPEKSRQEIADEVYSALDSGDFDAAFDAIGDGDIFDIL